MKNGKMNQKERVYQRMRIKKRKRMNIVGAMNFSYLMGIYQRTKDRSKIEKSINISQRRDYSKR